MGMVVQPTPQYHRTTFAIRLARWIVHTRGSHVCAIPVNRATERTTQDRYPTFSFPKVTYWVKIPGEFQSWFEGRIRRDPYLLGNLYTVLTIRPLRGMVKSEESDEFTVIRVGKLSPSNGML